VRVAIHPGLAEITDGDYVGRPVNRVARLMAAAHGGQILVSLATQQLVRDALPDGAKLLDLGIHRLKDLEHAEHISRLVAPGFPDVDTPLDTAERLAATERVTLDGFDADAACPYRALAAFREADASFFFGREAFTELLVEAVAAAPMVGVIGPSGSGKSSVVFAGLVPRLRPPSVPPHAGGGRNSAGRADKHRAREAPAARAGRAGLLGDIDGVCVGSLRACGEGRHTSLQSSPCAGTRRTTAGYPLGGKAVHGAGDLS
jgi:hypothetical protein